MPCNHSTHMHVVAHRPSCGHQVFAFLHDHPDVSSRAPSKLVYTRFGSAFVAPSLQLKFTIPGGCELRLASRPDRQQLSPDPSLAGTAPLPQNYSGTTTTVWDRYWHGLLSGEGRRAGTAWRKAGAQDSGEYLPALAVLRPPPRRRLKPSVSRDRTWRIGSRPVTGSQRQGGPPVSVLKLRR